jgi:hypothetical protein
MNDAEAGFFPSAPISPPLSPTHTSLPRSIALSPLLPKKASRHLPPPPPPGAS